MPELIFSQPFEKSFQRLSTELQTRARKSLDLFRKDPRHPSLHFEKLASTGSFTLRVDRNFRIVLTTVDPSTFEAVDIGDHDTIYRRYG